MKKIHFILIAAITFAGPSWSGSNYTLKTDRFTGTQTSSYELDVGSECSLTSTTGSSLKFCTFLNSSDNPDDPNIIMITTSPTWDIMEYRFISPYREGKIPAIITYTEGKTQTKMLGVKYKGDPIVGRGVMEVVLVELGTIKTLIPIISKIEVKYGTNEYLIIMDSSLTDRSLKFQ